MEIKYLEKFNKINGKRWNCFNIDHIWNSKKTFQKTSFEYRNEYTKKYSWAIPTPEAIKEIVKYSPLIEIGAGGGYWGSLISKAGGDIICFDHKPYNNYQVNCKWFTVKKGFPSTIKCYPHRNLFLCWPPYNDNMAERCLKYFKGEYVIYIGEGEGGCNATDEFFWILESKFREIDQDGWIPRWYGLHDYLCIYKRK